MAQATVASGAPKILGSHPIHATDILGPQARWRVVPANEGAQHPFSAVASLRFRIVSAAGERDFFAGSGWFVRPDRLVTCAHVVDVREAWAKVAGAKSWHLQIIPGVSFGQRPFGETWASRVLLHPRWNGVHSSGFDIALVRVPPVLDSQQCLQAHAGTPGSGRLGVVQVVGYPFAGFGGETAVRSEGPVLAQENPLMFYDLDTEDGQSGGPVLLMTPNREPQVVGLHSSGQGKGGSALAQGLNAGLAMREELLTWIETASI